MYSIQRRLERYMVIYIWKIIEGKVPNCGVSWTYNERRGRLCSIPPLIKSSRKIQSLRENSLQVIGPKLFNSMPQELRNLSGCSKEVFKSKLDLFLEAIPDQPKTPTLTPTAVNQITNKQSNSLIDMVRNYSHSTKHYTQEWLQSNDSVS